MLRLAARLSLLTAAGSTLRALRRLRSSSVKASSDKSTPANPPTTPPTMAPIFECEDDVTAAGSEAEVVLLLLAVPLLAGLGEVGAVLLAPVRLATIAGTE